MFAQAVNHFPYCVKASRHYFHRVISSNGKGQVSDHFLVDQVVAFIAVWIKTSKDIFVFVLLLQADTSLVAPILGCLGSDETTPRESNRNLTPGYSCLHSDILVEVPVAIVL